jgi:hypothetical protein
MAPETHPDGSCPSDEEIAAFIDGMLPDVERARVTAHLANCEVCFQVLAGALHFLARASVAGEEGRVILFPADAPERNRRESRSTARWWLAVAAAAFVLAALAAYQTFSAPAPQRIVVAHLIDQLEPEAAQHLYSFNRYRGDTTGSAEDLLSDKPSFMVGVLLVDLGLASSAKEPPETAAGILDQVSKELTSAGFMDDAARRYRDDALKARGSAAFVRQIAAGLLSREEDLNNSALDPTYLAFGKWTEAGRISAETRSRRFLKSWINRRFLNSLLKDPRQIEEGAVVSVKAIQKLWDRGTLQAADYDTLAEHFRTIIRRYDT